MGLNLRRGIVRFSLVFLALWAGFWTWTYFDADEKGTQARQQSEFYHDLYLREFGHLTIEETPDNANSRFLTKEDNDALAESRAQFERRESAFALGVSGSVAYLIVVLAFAWIWSGFQPTAPSPARIQRPSRMATGRLRTLLGARTTDDEEQPEEERHTIEKPRTKFFPRGLLYVVLIVSPYAALAYALAGENQPFFWQYSVALVQSAVIYGLTLAFQNRKRRTATDVEIHLRSLVISLIIVTVLAFGLWYGRSQA